MTNQEDLLTTSMHKATADTNNVIKAQAFVNQSQEEEIIDLGENFDFKGFQVVRREFFAHSREPAISFCNYKMYVNQSCLNKLPDTEFIQILMNQNTKVLALRPRPESAKDSFQWYSERKGKRTPKQITCKLFFAKLVKLMGWNPMYRYKILGKLIKANGEMLIAFDLSSTEIYPRTIVEGDKIKASRTPTYPEEWNNQFGLPYSEHQQSMQIDIFNGYAVYSIKDNQNASIPSNTSTIDTQEEVTNNG